MDCEIRPGAIFHNVTTVENVLRNAIRYAPEGTAVELALVCSGGAALVRVRDRGPGVPPEALPFPNLLRGKAEVLKAIQKVDEVVEVLGNDLEVVVVEGDRAAVICDRKLRQRATGRIMRYKVAAFHRYRNGRLVEYMAFADSFDMMQQALGRTLEVPLSFPEPPAPKE